MPTDASRPGTPRTGAASPAAPGCSSPDVLATPSHVLPPQQDRLAGRAGVEAVTRADPVGHVQVAAARLDDEQGDRILAVGDRQVRRGAARVGEPRERRGGA